MSKTVAQKLIDYLHHRITLTELVDWAESAMMEADFQDDREFNKTFPDWIKV